MVKEITYYKTDDGEVFDDFNKAEKYDLLRRKCDGIDSIVPKPENELTGYEFCQHDLGLVAEARIKAISLCRELGYYRDDENPGNEIEIISDNGRLIEFYDGMNYYGAENVPCLRRLLYRLFAVTDVGGREYSQPYFIRHSGEAIREVKEIASFDKENEN